MLNVLRVLPLLAGAVLAGPANAALWAVNNNHPSTSCDTVSNNGNRDTNCVVRGTDGTMATASGYANTGSIVPTSNASTRRWSTATLTDQGNSGLGVDHRTVNANGSWNENGDAGEGGNPEHAIDGDGRTDAVMFSFGSSVTLQKLQLGWVGSDSDLVVLYWSGGNVAPNMSDYYLNSNTTGTTNMLASGAWSMLGRYANVSTAELNLQNTTGASSGWWLITAYNAAFAGADIKHGAKESDYGQGNDYFKLLSVSGDTEVPAPGALALGALGLFFAARSRRPRTQA